MSVKLVKFARSLTLLCLALAGSAAPLAGQGGVASAAAKPKSGLSYASQNTSALPAIERFEYARSVGEAKGSLSIELARKSERGKTWYELVTHAPDEDGVYTLDPTNLALLRSDVTTRSASTIIRRVTEVVEDKPVLAPDELQISATEAFRQRIRLIRFEEKPVYSLTFQGSQAMPGFSLALTVVGREKVEAGGRTWDCWRVEVGAKGVVGGLFGRSRYWYQAEWPHVLVKFEGPSSFPGSPQTRLELISYSAS